MFVNFQRYGGNSWLVHIYRSWFELKTTLTTMWLGNPILTMVLFGLPGGFLSLICYGICCPDILDADDEEEGKSVAFSNFSTYRYVKDLLNVK